MKPDKYPTHKSAPITRPRHILLTTIASLIAAHTGMGADAIFSSGAFTSDATSGVSTSKTYTAIINVIGNDVLVNEVTFAGSGTALTGATWDLTGVPNLFGSTGNHTTTFGASAIDDLFDGFQFGGEPGTLTFSGLTAGQTYVATMYNEAWSWPGVDDRTNIFTSSEGASTLYNPDAVEASVLRYTFVATGGTTTLNFRQTRTNYSMHVYGLSNEQVFNNTWSPVSGDSWDTVANWSSGVVPNALGTNASFSAQAGPTTVTIPATRTVGHIEFLGTGSYTVNGGLVRLQADAGGTSVLNTEAGGSHTINATLQLLSDVVKFGGGTLTLGQDIVGLKSVTVSGGTLRLGLENSYTGGTAVGAGATLDLNNTNQTFNVLNGAGAIVNDNSGASLATIESGTFSGSIRDHQTGTGTVALTKTTGGTLTLSGSNTYTGATTINAGTLRLQGTASTALLTDNFLAPNNPNTADLNFNLANRQTGSTAPQPWSPVGNTQVGNPTTVQQSAGTHGNYLLLAFGASASLDGLPLSTANAPGPLKINFDMFRGNTGNPTEWTSFAIRSAGGNGFPVTGSGEFGFLYRQNSGLQIFNNNTEIGGAGSTAAGDSFGVYLADSAGTGSPFAGNGTRVVLTQGGSVVGSYALDTGMAASSFINFGSAGGMIGGVDNLAVTPITIQTNVLDPATAISLNSATSVLKLEDVHQTVASLSGGAGTAVNMLPFSRLTVSGTTNSTFNGTTTGPLASFVKDGPSVLELGGASSYTGGTTIAGGALITHNVASLGTGSVSIAAGANYLPWFNTGSPVIPHHFTLNGPGGNAGDGNKGAIYADGGGGGYAEYQLTGTVTLAATSNVGGNNQNNLNLLGKVTGPGGLVKGAGRIDENSTLTLSNTANDYAGNTVIINGVVRLGASEVIPHGAGKGNVAISAGTILDLAGNNERINNLSGFGTITTSPAVTIGAPVFFSTNADSGISGAKTYTHRLDFGDGAAATVNTVAFDPAANSGPDWSLTGATALLPEATGAASTPSFPDGPNGTAMNQLLSDFYFNGNPAALTLTGLTSGTSYELRLYQRQWGGDRTQLFTFNAGAATGSSIYNQDASATPSYLSFRYTTDATGTATLSTTQLGTGTYHWYGLTNEEVSIVPNPVLTVGDATDSTFGGTITGNLEINKEGSGTLTLDGVLSFPKLTVSAGTINVNSALGAGTSTVNANATANFGVMQTLAALNVGATGVAKLAPHAGGPANITPIDTSALTIAAGGKLDLTNNAMVVRGGDIGDITDLVASGSNGLAWDGAGINSSTAFADANFLTGIGVIDNAEYGYTDFANVTGLTGAEILVKYTYYGDSDLSGQTTADDFTLFFDGFTGAAPASWLYGDYDYDGAVTVDDFTLFVSALNSGAPALAPDGGAAASPAAVPEPGSLALFLAGALGLLRRRR